MILLVDMRHPDTKLGKWLANDAAFSPNYMEVNGKDFRARIWRV
jgi:hypothetical protein